MPHAADRPPSEGRSEQKRSIHWPVVGLFGVGLCGVVAAASLAVGELLLHLGLARSRDILPLDSVTFCLMLLAVGATTLASRWTARRNTATAPTSCCPPAWTSTPPSSPWACPPPPWTSSRNLRFKPPRAKTMRQLSVRQESWPLRGVFRISRGSYTDISVVVVEISDGEATGRGARASASRLGPLRPALGLDRGRVHGALRVPAWRKVRPLRSRP